MNELVLNVAKNLNDRIAIIQEDLVRQVASTVVRRAANQRLQQGATVIEVSRFCETAYSNAAAEISSELTWAIDHAIYTSVKFVQKLEQMARGFIEQIVQVVDGQIQKAEQLSNSPPHQLRLHLQGIKERAMSSIEVAAQRRRIERYRWFLLKLLGVLLSLPVAGYLIKSVVSWYFK